MAEQKGTALHETLLEDDLLDSDEEDTPFARERLDRSDNSDKQSALIESITSSNFDLDLEDEMVRAQFLADYKLCFTGGEHGTLIHMALQTCDDSAVFDRFKPLFTLIVGEYPEILEMRNSMAETTLHYAIQRRLSDAAVYLCRCAPEDAAVRAIGCRGRDQGNCLHAAIQSGLKMDATEYFISVCKADAALDVDDLGRTPLHYAVGETFRASSTFLRSRMALKEEYFPPNSLQLVRILVEKNDAALRRVDKRGRTPYQQRVHQLERKMAKATGSPKTSTERKRPGPSKTEQTGNDTVPSAESPPNLRELVLKDPVASFIRLYCMRKFSRGDIMGCLYQPSQERQIEFDLSGLPHKTISEDYLDRLSEHLRFENVLKYVLLPRLTIETPASSHRSRASTKDGRRQGASLLPVFNWLRRNDVEKIIKVIVIDDEEPTHTDSSIEEALCGFDVETWDWKRLDLSTEVIYTAAPYVKEICLYSTGNNAVLMGWASPNGLPKFTELKSVNVFVQKGRESIGRLKGYLRDFAEALEALTCYRLNVSYMILGDDNVSFASAVEKREDNMQAETPWVDCIQNFATLLRRAPAFSKTQPVRVAVIDDGIDATHSIFDGKIAAGRSFYPNTGGLTSPFYISSTAHGTYMSTIIATLCPNVKLYIAKLDGRRINAQEASQAISWAAACGVDIISMSWSIRSPTNEHRGLIQLRDAVNRARSKRVVMLCAANDSGSYDVTERSYPGSFEGCIQIGAASEDGNMLSWGNPANVDFLLPGDNILPFNEISDTISNVKGSSVATAVAVGLAGFLLSCSRFLGDDRDDYWRRENSIRYAFTILATSRGGKFPFVQQYFESSFMQELKRIKGPQFGEDSRSIPNVEWDESCTEALKAVMDSLRRLH